MSRFGLCGPSYVSQSPVADPEDVWNWYPESIEGSGKSAFALYPSPGLAVFSNPGGNQTRGGIGFVAPGSITRVFVVVDAVLWELFQDGTNINRGAVANDGFLASFAYNQANQLLVASGGTVYLYDLTANKLSQPTGLQGAVSQVGFDDTYFVALLKGTNQFQISGSVDGTSWPGIQKNAVSVFADALQGMIVDHRELWLWSGTHGVGYYNTGSSSIFDPIGASSFVEDGIGAPSSCVKADNTFFWINANERGGGIAKRLNGTIPVRVSNHAVEYQWSKYPTLSDAVGYSYEDQGHTFIHWHFPSANASWRYDVSLQMWHRVGFWDSANATYTAHRSWWHVYAWGRHLVGDWRTGAIYSMSIQNVTDFGNPGRWERICPPISSENEWIFHNALQIDLEPGLASITDTGHPTTLVLASPNGQLWQLAVSDGGVLSQTAVPSGLAQTLFLNDAANANSYQVTVSNAGVLSQTGVTLNGTYGQGPTLVSSGGIVYQVRVAGGILSQVAIGTQVRAPQIVLSWSDDGGKTWSNDHALDCGKLGEYRTRVILRRLGRSRSRCYRIVATDPIPWRIIEGDLTATPDFAPKQRLTKQFQQVS